MATSSIPPRPRPSHKRHSSSSTATMTRLGRDHGALSTPEHTPGSSTRKSKMMTSVRRSLSVTPKKSRTESDAYDLYYSTTTEEQTYTASRIRRDDPSRSPPTIEQIAMGLHLSRTPHLRNGGPSHHHRTPSIALPPPPARSSLKKPSSVPSNPGLTPSVSSATTFTSLSTPQSSLNDRNSNSSAFFSLKMSSRMMSRFLPRSLSSSSSSPSSLRMSASPRASMSSESVTPQKKAVRFSEPGGED
ncbi:hypothetical protein VNI00_002973 [Paramarasmius palmivorus]|uniref:Uncharacterized protein n=1 Tax=Paramarasmius palmivorus TaxID=297713 RepID=A0AAW0DZB5_9AGAR